MTPLGKGKSPAQEESGAVEDMFKPQVPKGARKGVMRLALTFAVVFIIAIIVLVLYVRSAISSVEAAAPPPTISGQVHGGIHISSNGALLYNNSKYIIEYANGRYFAYNSTNVTAQLTVYTANPLRRIYLLNVQNYCINCFVGSSLYTALSSSLSQYGLLQNRSSLAYVNINNIDNIPQGSIIIIPSGLFPEELMPDVSYTDLCPKYTNSTLVSLLEQGDVIMYVGRNFSRSVSCSGQAVQNSPQTIAAVDRVANTSSITVNLTANVLYLNNATFTFLFGESYGTASAVNVGKQGAMVALSNYPSTGWSNNDTLLAGDIAKVLSSAFWIQPIANGSVALPGANYISSNFTVFTLNQVVQNGPGAMLNINDAYPILRLMISNNNSFSQYETPAPATLNLEGSLSMPPVVGIGVSSQVAGQIYNTSGKVTIAYAQLYNANLTPLQDQVIRFGQMGPSQVYLYYSFVLPQGYYFANLTDQNGRQYARSMFYVAGINVTPTRLDFKNDTFSFLALSNGEPITGVPYSVNLNGAYNSTGYVQGGDIGYTLPKGTAVSYGQKTFNITLLGSSFDIPYSYQSQGIKIPPFYIEVAIEAVIIAAIIKVLVPPDIDEYYIDVPDIKPVQRQTIKESAETIVNVFDKVNLYYHWKNMPLTVDEIKNGIGNYVKYGNMKVAVTARTTYALLDRLMVQGVVEEAGDYYALKKWTEQANHSIEYLVIYRRLRDFCVSNAMLFTELDATSDVDMIITNKSVNNFIKIYSEGMRMKDIVVKQGGRMFLAFLNEEKRQTFLDKLYAAYGNDAEIMKMAIRFGQIKLIDMGHLEELKH